MAALLVIPLVCSGAAPTLEHLYPAGAVPGSTNVISMVGKPGNWPPQVWIDTPAIRFLPTTNQGKFEVHIDADAPAGPRLLRLFNDEGASEPRMFVVGAGREISDAEPNNHFAEGQEAGALPVTVNGRLDKNGDVDSFRIPMRAGQWLEARLEAYVLMSKIDGVLRLVTTNGQPLAWNHDFVSLDPQLRYEAINDAVVVLQVMGFAYPATAEVRLAGGDGAIYRLHLALTEKQPAGPCERLSEKEPNNIAAEAEEIVLPAEITGAIDRVGDEDRFCLRGQADEVFEARLEARVFGSPLDAWIEIQDESNKRLARADDGDGSTDPRVEWKTKGTNFVVVGNVLRRGGSDYRYRLKLQKLAPAYQATLNTFAVALEAGKTNEIKVAFKRLRGFKAKLTVALDDLPAGISADPIEVPEKDGEIILRLVAKPEATAANQPVRILVKNEETGEARPITASLTSTSVDNGVPGGYTRLLVERTETIWLTVRVPPAK